MHRLIAATMVAAWLVPVSQAQAEDASLVIEDNAVRRSVSATPPGNAIGPLALVGAQVWYGARSGRADIAVLQSTPAGGVEIAGAGGGLMLAYTQPATFVSLADPGSDDERMSAIVLHHAQALGSKPKQVRITRTARADLDEAPGVETIVEASSWPPFTSADTGHSFDFAGIFVLSESGQPLGQIFEVGGREGTGSRMSEELVAIAKNPFDGAWDFLIDGKYISAPHDDADDDQTGDVDDDDDDVDVDEPEASGARPEQTFYRWVKVYRYSAGQFAHRKGMDWIKSKTCFGADCFD